MVGADEFTLVAAGDVAIRRARPDEALALLAPVFREADVAFCNQELPLCDGSLPPTQYDRRVRSQSDPEMVEGIAGVGLDFVGLANNHMTDYGVAGLLQTIAQLEKKGIPFIGAGHDIQQARAPRIVERKGTRVAILASYCGDQLGSKAGVRQPGVAIVRMNPFLPPPHLYSDEVEVLLEEIEAAKREADIVILFEHWGVSYTTQLSVPAVALGHMAIDAGADVILGHHPHVLQGIEVYEGKAIFYSLGNLVFDRPTLPFATDTQTILVRISVADKRVRRVSVLPVQGTENGQARSLSMDNPESEAILAKMDKLSRPLGTLLKFEGGEAIVPVTG